jgi:co-chaperonin GroES (HSP10)
MFHPVRNFVQFVPVDIPNVSKGGIVAPESYKSNNGPDATEVKTPKRAKVVAVGPGKLLTSGFREVCCKPGDYIQLTLNAFVQTVLLNGEMIYITEDDYIAGTLDEDDVALRVVQPEEEKKKIVPVSKLSLQ